ncbi:MAG: hypothetical protein ACI9QL_004617, partial [Candidatus Omnitrophota bacterium]
RREVALLQKRYPSTGQSVSDEFREKLLTGRTALRRRLRSA